MTPLHETLAGLYGAWRLARADRSGMAYFNTTHEGFWRSFISALIVAPIYIVLLVMRYHAEQLTVPPVRYVALEAISYVVAWFIFPLVMFYLVQAIERERQFLGFVIAYNWASVWQNFLYLPVSMVGEMGVLPEDWERSLELAALVLVFIYTFYITKISLQISNLLAVGIVVVDFLVSVFLNLITEMLLHR